MDSMSSSSKIAYMMAKPPGSTGARADLSPGMRSGSARPASMSRSHSLSRPSRVMPSAANLFSSRMPSMLRALPEEPTASCQPARR